MKVCVGTLAAATGTGISIELMDCDIVGAGCSITVEVVSSLASGGMHTRLPISRICAELYGTAKMRPLLMHTPPCLPPEQGSRVRGRARAGTPHAELIDGFDSPRVVGCGDRPEETEDLGLRIELEDGATAPWDGVDLACAGGRKV